MTRLAMDIGATKIAFASFDSGGEPEFVLEVPTESSHWERLAQSLESGIRQAEDTVGRVAEIGVSVGGTVDPRTGNVACANIPAISGRDLKAELERLTGRPVFLKNDAECLALAEATGGIGQSYGNVFAIILGSGIGGALVVNSKLITGATGQLGEWGHGNQIDHLVEKHKLTSRVCGCGRRNCLDLFGAGLGMANIHADLSHESKNAKQILHDWGTGDPGAAKTIRTYIDIVSSQLVSVINVIDPDIVPVAGGLSQNAPLIEEIDKATRARSLGQFDRPLIVPANNRKNGCLYGASLLTAENT